MNRKHDKQEILLQGIYLFRRQGYHNTGVNDILRTCGIPKGSFYNFFTSKEDFCLQVLDLYARRMYFIMERQFSDDSLPAIDRIKQYYTLTNQAAEEEEARYGCLLMNLMSEAAGFNDRLAETANLLYEEWMDLLAEIVAEAQAAGDLTDQYTPRQLAEWIQNSFFGAYVRGKCTRNTEPHQLNLELVFERLSIL